MRGYLKKAIIQVIAIVCCITSFCESASAYTVTTSGKSTIAPTDVELRMAKNDKYDREMVSINQSISSSYEMDIIRYNAPKAGYYAIYTTGTTDTVGKVYEEQNVLLWTTDFLEKSFNDDDGDGTNYKHVIKLDMWEDYYICTRAYSDKKGAYKLVVKPNDDAIESNVGGMWINDDSGYIPGLTMDAKILQKKYLTKEQVAKYYQCVRDRDTRESIGDYYEKRGILGTLQIIEASGIDLFNIVEVVGVINLSPEMSFAANITEKMLEIIFTTIFKNKENYGEILAQLETYGGAGYVKDTVTGADTYVASQGICITTNYCQSDVNVSMYDIYSKYDSQIIKGVAYGKGHWE